MYKDVKNGGKRRRPAAAAKGNYGLEILNSGEGKDLKDGSIIPIRSDLTIGRKEDNSIGYLTFYGYHNSWTDSYFHTIICTEPKEKVIIVYTEIE